jgi:Protein of unknown function (DUF3489)
MSRIRDSRLEADRAGIGASDPDEIASVACQTKTGAVAERQAVTEAVTNKRGTSKKPNKTKSALIVGLLKRKSGASLEELQRSSGWQAHSVRGFLSGTLKKRMGLRVISAVTDTGVRRYRLTV